jgi:hypothetical protein
MYHAVDSKNIGKDTTSTRRSSEVKHENLINILLETTLMISFR